MGLTVAGSFQIKSRVPFRFMVQFLSGLGVPFRVRVQFLSGLGYSSFQEEGKVPFRKRVHLPPNSGLEYISFRFRVQFLSGFKGLGYSCFQVLKV